MRFLLDTTVLIDHAHGLAGASELLERLFSEPHDLMVCDVVVTEALSKGPDEEMLVIGTLIRAVEYVATHPEAARWAGESRRRRLASGPRSLADAIIAGVAHDLDATVVTRNPRDFASQGVPVLAYGRPPAG
jgi:predicted nucleic acid-binding protein